MKKALRVSLPVLFSVLAFGASASVALAATNILTSATQTTNEDTPLIINLLATDAGTVTFATTTSPTHGTLGTIGTTTPLGGGVFSALVTYTPDLNFNGTDAFTFIAGNGTSTSTLTTTITVTAVNDAPVATSTATTTPEDTSVIVSLSATDVDSPTLTFLTVASPLHGTLGTIGTSCTPVASGTSCTATTTYTPDLNFNGIDTFTFKANDTLLDSNIATSSITITAVNDAPVASPATATTTGNSSVSVTLTAADVDSPALTFATTTSPTNGTLGPVSTSTCITATTTTCTAHVTYTPTLNASVIDTFNFTASDGLLTSNVATATTTVTSVAVTSPSLLTAATFGVLAGTFTNTGATTIIGNVGYTTPPATPAIVNGIVFTPKPAQAGLDQGSALASLNAQLCTFVFAPGAIDLSTDTTHVGSVGVFSPGVYCSTGAMSISGPLTLSGSGTYIFRPVGALDSAASSIVTLTGATAGNVFWTPSGATTLGANSTFAGTVIDNSGITVGSTVVWTGRALAFGGTVTTSNDTISVPGVVADIAPVASSTSATTAEDTPVSVTFSASDVDGNMLSFATSTNPLHGTLGAFASSSCTILATTSTCTSSALYTPALNFNGADVFNVVANDGVLSSAMATATIAITAVNDAPVATPASATTPEDTPVDVTLSATDIDSPALTFMTVANPTNGVFGPVSTSTCVTATTTTCTAHVTYTPALNFNGTDTFTFMSNDGSLDSNTATATVTVTAVNDAPVATTASATTNENSPVSVTLSATDIDSLALSFLSVSSPTSGILGPVSTSTCITVASSSSCTAHVTYTPALNFNGTDTFTFKANDGSLDSNVATATVNIAAVLSFVATTNVDGSLTATTTNATTATTSASGVLAALTIPTGTVITGPATWDQTLSLPVTTATFTLTPDAGNTAAAVTAVEVGAGDTPLALDTAVMLTFTGQAGMLVGWSQASVFHPITSVCDSTTTPTLAVGGDCKVDVGADLFVFTKHLSTFVVYTQTPIPPAPVTPNISGGGGQSFGAISPVFMGNATGGNSSGGVTASTVVPGLPQTGIAPVSSGLSDKQVESLIMVLNSFGVDKVTMNKVLASLHRSTGSGQISFPNTGNVSFSRDLKSGETDTDVESLQKFLNGHGFAVSDSGPGSSGEETTSFGPKTRAALIKFQKARGITPAVGFFGPKTRAAV